MRKIFVLFFMIIYVGCSSDVRDAEGNRYKIVKIGNQVWMAENLRTRAAKDSWCYANIAENCEKYGRLYTWVAAMAFPDSCYDHKCELLGKHPHQGICPDGFHIPSIDEFNELYEYVGKASVALKLRSKKSRTKEEIAGDKEIYGEKNFDEFGFNLLLGGLAFNVKELSDGADNGSEKRATGLWTCNKESVIDTTFAWFVKLTKGMNEKLNERFDIANSQCFLEGADSIIPIKLLKNGGSYLRCIKD